VVLGAGGVGGFCSCWGYVNRIVVFSKEVNKWLPVLVCIVSWLEVHVARACLRASYVVFHGCVFLSKVGM
jgi:hypothetical protein